MASSVVNENPNDNSTLSKKSTDTIGKPNKKKVLFVSQFWITSSIYSLHQKLNFSLMMFFSAYDKKHHNFIWFPIYLNAYQYSEGTAVRYPL